MEQLGKVSPPTVNHSILRLWELNGKAFEELCIDLVKKEYGNESTRKYGIEGITDRAVDFIAEDEDKSIILFQCKCYKKYTKSNLTKHINEFKKNIDHWKRYYNIKSYIIITASQLDETEIQDFLYKLKNDFSIHDITFNIWGAREIQYRLSQYPEIVKRFFHSAWVNIVCGQKKRLISPKSIKIYPIFDRIPEEAKHSALFGDDFDKTCDIDIQIKPQKWNSAEENMLSIIKEIKQDHNSNELHIFEIGSSWYQTNNFNIVANTNQPDRYSQGINFNFDLNDSIVNQHFRDYEIRNLRGKNIIEKQIDFLGAIPWTLDIRFLLLSQEIIKNQSISDVDEFVLPSGHTNMVGQCLWENLVAYGDKYSDVAILNNLKTLFEKQNGMKQISHVNAYQTIQESFFSNNKKYLGIYGGIHHIPDLKMDFIAAQPRYILNKEGEKAICSFSGGSLLVLVGHEKIDPSFGYKVLWKLVGDPKMLCKKDGYFLNRIPASRLLRKEWLNRFEENIPRNSNILSAINDVLYNKEVKNEPLVEIDMHDELIRDQIVRSISPLPNQLFINELKKGLGAWLRRLINNDLIDENIPSWIYAISWRYIIDHEQRIPERVQDEIKKDQRYNYNLPDVDRLADYLTKKMEKLTIDKVSMSDLLMNFCYKDDRKNIWFLEKPETIKEIWDRFHQTPH